MTIHIGAKAGEIAETVLMPGDPMRAKWAAERYLSDATCINQVRGMLGFTGTWQGHRVTIQGSGMGMPSMSIYAHELIRDYGAKTIIRVGSAGAMQDHVQIRDLVLAQGCATLSTPSKALAHDMNLAPLADFGLLKRAYDVATGQGMRAHVGQIYCSDTFYDERTDLTAILQRHGTLAVEMEAAELYLVAARHNVRALAILTISDHLITQEALPADAREQSFGQMIDLALQTAFAV